MAAIHRDFGYAPYTTRVDSPIDEALNARAGGVPGLHAHHARLAAPAGFARAGTSAATSRRARSVKIRGRAPSPPTRGSKCCCRDWAGSAFDPTNNIEAGLRHVRVAVGRDYADVPPTRGVYKGGSTSTLAVSVEVTPGETLPTLEPRCKRRPGRPRPSAGRGQDFERRPARAATTAAAVVAFSVYGCHDATLRNRYVDLRNWPAPPRRRITSRRSASPKGAPKKRSSTPSWPTRSRSPASPRRSRRCRRKRASRVVNFALNLARDVRRKRRLQAPLRRSSRGQRS